MGKYLMTLAVGMAIGYTVGQRYTFTFTFEEHTDV